VPPPGSEVHLISIGDEPPRALPGPSIQWFDLAFSPDGRFAAAASADWELTSRKIVIWDVDSGEQVTVLAEGELATQTPHPQFVGNSGLMALHRTGLRRWNLATGDSELLYEGSFNTYAATADGRRVLLLEAPTPDDPGRAVFLDLDTGVTTPLATHGDRVWKVALDASGEIAVTGDFDGIVRVGPVTGEEPHLLLGHENSILALDIDPLGRWIASGGEDLTARLWPMPDLSKPPLHALPHEELVAKLKSLTNVRVVRDEETGTGWKLTHDPFPGWETVPEW